MIGALGTVPKGLVRGMEKSEIEGQAGTIQSTALLIGQNTEKSSGYLKRLAVTWTPVKDYQLLRKTRKE